MGVSPMGMLEPGAPSEDHDTIDIDKRLVVATP